MTDAPKTEPKKIDWPQAAIAIAICAMVGLFWGVLEPEVAESATSSLVGVLVTVLALLGLAATLRGSIAPEGVGAMLGAVLGRSSSTPMRRDRPKRREEGSAGIEALAAIFVAAVCWALGALVSGCGAGAIAVHARAATIATVALEGVVRAGWEAGAIAAIRSALETREP